MSLKLKKLPASKHFMSKMAKTLLLAGSFLTLSLGIGLVGYHYFFRLSWVDALLNASMILTGMGPVNTAPDNGAKIFSSFYAIYSGVAFLSSIAFLFTPVLHRFLHKFHLDLEENS